MPHPKPRGLEFIRKEKRGGTEGGRWTEHHCAGRNNFISLCDRCQNSSKPALGLHSTEYTETIFYRGEHFEAGGQLFLFFYSTSFLFRLLSLFHLWRWMIWFSLPDVTQHLADLRLTNRQEEKGMCIRALLRQHVFLWVCESNLSAYCQTGCV